MPPPVCGGGAASLRTCSYVAMWLCGYVAIELCGYMAMWLCGYVPMWLCGYVALSNQRTDSHPDIRFLHPILGPIGPPPKECVVKGITDS